MKKFARSVAAAFALVMVAGALSACADLESRKSADSSAQQRAADNAQQASVSANRAASVSSQK